LKDRREGNEGGKRRGWGEKTERKKMGGKLVSDYHLVICYEYKFGFSEQS